jgi:hypothetical protein
LTLKRPFWDTSAVLAWIHRHRAALAAFVLFAAGLSFGLCEHACGEAETHHSECACLCHAQAAPAMDTRPLPSHPDVARLWSVAASRHACLIEPDIFRPPIA